MTDVEETAQWLSGEDLVQKVVASLLSGLRPAGAITGIVIHNAFAYEGHLEKGIINGNFPAVKAVGVLS